MNRSTMICEICQERVRANSRPKGSQKQWESGESGERSYQAKKTRL